MAVDILNKIVEASVSVTKTINNISALLVFLCFLVFIWGFVSYSRKISDGKADSTKEYQLYMIWSVIALFVLTSIWGLIAFIRGVIFADNFGTSNNIETVRVR